MKKSLILFLVAVLSMAMLSACGPKDADAAATVPAYENGMVSGGDAVSASNAG